MLGTGMWFYVPAALYVLRDANWSDHGYFAFNLVYGRQPRDVLDDESSSDLKVSKEE